MALPAPANPAPARNVRTFRDTLGRLATGVAFVTAAPDGEPAGLIVNSLTSVSLDPPLVAFCPSRSSLTWSRMRRAGRFGVNILGRQHERFAKRATPAARTDSPVSTGNTDTAAYRYSPTPSPPSSVRSSPSTPPAIAGSSSAASPTCAPRPSKTHSSSSPADSAPCNEELPPHRRASEHHSLHGEGVSPLGHHRLPNQIADQRFGLTRRASAFRRSETLGALNRALRPSRFGTPAATPTGSYASDPPATPHR